MLKITAEEVNFVIYQYLHESGTLKQPFLIDYRLSALGIRLCLGG